MFIEPLVDIWRGETAAYVLVDERSHLYRPEYPAQLRLVLERAYERALEPLLVTRPEGLRNTAAWTEFVREFRAARPTWHGEFELWELREEGKRAGEVWDVYRRRRLLNGYGGDGRAEWALGVATEAERAMAIRTGVRYACGPVFGAPEPLYNSVVALRWAFA
ncbi:MAG: hypothetical protein ACYCYO_17860 [Bacilli bacterium]